MDHIFDENQPIYLQIKHRISARILREEFKPGDKLPGVVDAAMQYKVNHNTIQRVYQELIRDGVAVSRRGEGTFVTEDVTVLKKMQGELQNYFLENFVQQMLRLGYRKEDLAHIVQSYVSQSQQCQQGKEK
ncbi:MAG: GntR family transcriptional regulator [Flexilinea sp.]